ncbi:DUF1566 domain-containing protein [Leptospira sp. 201903070]|uniref:DUF1566 domain-containing protein n=1 Tax=Leptospira ainlahdjerensis TaxID=2810033 RepID=A0ABS2U9U3_9LEPT|nr:DUF1566 domain-containing protein [Leptospira ainlahdjerensis]MBM9577150.1 DUF1566 domain-containing protein [Leptospira ainlahdjerensis]
MKKHRFYLKFQILFFGKIGFLPLILLLILSNCLTEKENKNRSFFFFPSGISNDPSVVNNSDGTPIPVSFVPSTTGNLTYSSSNPIYVSGQTGAIEFVDVQWNSSMAAAYEIRYGSTNCSDGNADSSGSVLASTSTTSRIHAIAGVSALSLGNNTIRICLFNPADSTLWDSYSLNVVRDDVAPTVSFTPSAGTYGSSAPNVSISCTDTGNSGCYKTAYRTDGTSASISNAGAAGTGSSLFSSAITLPNNTTTNFSALAVDKAGNIGSTNSASYVVAFGNPTITMVSLSKNSIQGTGSSTLRWKSDIAGNYSVRAGGSDCSTGSSLSTGTAAANTNVDSVIAGSDLSAGANSIRVCLTTAGSNVGTSTASIARDDVSPQIISVSPPLTPNSSAYALSVSQKTFSLTFNEDMDTSLTPNPQHRDQTTAGDPEIKWPGVVGSWSADKRTYTLDILSNLPEWHKFYLLYNGTSFKDIAGNVVTSSPTVSVVSGNIILNYGTVNDVRNLIASDTRQTVCSDASGNVVSCAGTGQDGEFTALSPGLLAPGTLGAYTNDYVTVDTKNLRIWKSCLFDYEWNGTTCVKTCAADQMWNGTACVADLGNPYKTFNRSIEDCSKLNLRNSGNGYAGKKSWRVPTLEEYYTILEYGGSVGNEVIPETYFPGILRDNYQRYWTSTNAITISSSNRASLSPAIDPLSNGPINYSSISTLQSWGAWSVSVFGGVTQPNNKLKDTSWSWPTYNFTSLCVAE